tara:strand:- start:1512 stop:2396 length:885 start_codon:yes stop_codon:yes gene_type:complete
MTIKHLVLSGGAYKGFYTIGAIKYLINKEFFKMKDIETIYGTSVGSLIGGILCLKLNIKDITEYAINKPWEKAFKFSVDSLLDIIGKKGFIEKKFIEDIFINLLKGAGLNSNITLKKLYEFSNIMFNIFTVNMTKFELEKINYKTHPDMKLTDAIYLSCSLPFIFQPCYIDNNCYIDGGIINPYPMNICLADLKLINPDINKKEILGFKIVDDQLESVPENSSIFHFGFYMLYRLIKENYNYVINEKIPYELIIPARTINIGVAKDIIVSKLEREKLVKDGENYAKLFLTYIKA